MELQDADGRQAKENERSWFLTLGILTILWAIAFVPQWLFWDSSAIIFGALATLAGCMASLVWIAFAAVLRSLRMLAVGLMVGALSAAVTQGVPQQIKARVTLASREGYYLRVIEGIKSNPNLSHESEHGEDVLFEDKNGRLKVGFLFGNSFINGGALVYDPAEDLTRPGRMQPQPIFGGTLASVQHLRGPWYYCTIELD